jgi:hypothetical protein
MKTGMRLAFPFSWILMKARMNDLKFQNLAAIIPNKIIPHTTSRTKGLSSSFSTPVGKRRIG